MMDYPRVLGLQTAVPDRCYSQDEVAGFYVSRLSEKGKRRERAIRTVLSYSGVAYRYSAVDASFYDTPKSTRERNDVYMVEAVKLGERLIRAGLERAEVAPEQITTLIVASCTGFNIPGLDLLLAGRLGLRPDLSRTCVLGMGCYGAFPAMRRAWENVQTKPKGVALVLALELCSLHLQFDDSVETAVSTSLFADGAGMMLIAPASQATMHPQGIGAGRDTTPTVATLLKRSTDLLDRETCRRFAYLGLFVPKPATFDLEAMAVAWDVSDPRTVARVLVNRGLLEPVSGGRFQMHALLVLHARSLLEEEEIVP